MAAVCGYLYGEALINELSSRCFGKANFRSLQGRTKDGLWSECSRAYGKPLGQIQIEDGLGYIHAAPAN